AQRDDIFSSQTIRHAGGQVESRVANDSRRAGRPNQSSGIAEQTSRSATPPPPHGVRSRNVARDGFLQRHRKLFTAFVWPATGIEALHDCRFFSERPPR